MAATKITDLPVDILSRIIIVVAKSPDGARDVARTLPTCRHFLEASNNNVVQRAVCFDNMQVSYGAYLFQRRNGLLNSCAKSGNSLAVHLLAQVILVTCTQLVDTNITKSGLDYFRDYSPNNENGRSERAHKNGVAASFLAHFTPVPGSNATQESDPSLTFHWEFVKVFLLKSTANEIKQMGGHLLSYIELFTEYRFNRSDLFAFMQLINTISIISASGERNWLLSYEEDHSHFTIHWREYFVPTPNIEIIDLWRSGDLIEYLQEKLVDTFERIIPMLG